MGIHVLQLGPYPPPEGGVTRNVLAIRERLLDRGDQCSIIATSKSTEPNGGPDIYRPDSAAALVSLIRKIDHDVLHLHVGGEINKRVLALCLASATFGKHPVLSVHSGGYAKTPEARNADTRSARARVFRRFSRIIVVNRELQDVFLRYGVPKERIQVIAPFALTPPDPQVRVSGQLESFARSHSPLLLSVGGLEPDYGPLLLIELMKEVLVSHPNAGLMIVGGGSMREQVEKCVEESGSAASILLAGDVPHAEALHLIAKADALLRLTLFDGDAISVREALFFGTPVIATDNGMRPEGVRCVNVGVLADTVRIVRDTIESTIERPQRLHADHQNIDKVLSLYKGLL
jgi:glycosyltransferase involved in cell wall biosynthesis